VRTRIGLYIALLVFLFFAAWQGAAVVTNNSIILPGPFRVALSLLSVVSSSSFPNNLYVTISAVVLGLVAGAAIGLAIGFLMGVSETAQRVLHPYMSFFMSLPKIIFLPLFIFAFGLGIEQRIFFAAAQVLFMMAVTTYGGISSVQPSLIKLSKSVGYHSSSIFLKVTIPWALPTMLTGVRLGFLFSFIGVLISEMYLPTAGLGSLLEQYSSNLQTNELLATIAVIALISITVNQVTLLLEYRLSRWRGNLQ
jgi:ABC-type nitrate/sulfonate/bicarbonate transport system permease component